MYLSNQPVVSVVIPCLNRAHFLIPTIESILQQSYPHIECIVMDGGSTDNTVDILKSYGSRIKWASEPDSGHADAINKGWAISKGEILAWLNADDMWEVPNAVSQAVSYLQSHLDVDVVYGDCSSVDINGNLVGMSYIQEWNLEYAVENCDHCIPQPASFIKRTILEKVGWLDRNFYQKKDHELWLRIGLIGKIQRIPIRLANERNVKGLSYDGRTAAPACIQVTKKFYSLSDIPLSLSQKKPRALSNSYLKGMLYAFEGGYLWNIILKYALYAVIQDPTNGINAIRTLRSYVAIRVKEKNYPQWLVWLIDLPVSIRRTLERIQQPFPDA